MSAYFVSDRETGRDGPERDGPDDGPERDGERVMRAVVEQFSAVDRGGDYVESWSHDSLVYIAFEDSDEDAHRAFTVELDASDAQALGLFLIAQAQKITRDNPEE